MRPRRRGRFLDPMAAAAGAAEWNPRLDRTDRGAPGAGARPSPRPLRPPSTPRRSSPDPFGSEGPCPGEPRAPGRERLRRRGRGGASSGSLPGSRPGPASRKATSWFASTTGTCASPARRPPPPSIAPVTASGSPRRVTNVGAPSKRPGPPAPRRWTRPRAAPAWPLPICAKPRPSSRPPSTISSAPYCARPSKAAPGSCDIDVGEIVSPGTPVARLFAVDVAEVRLPIPDSELAFLSVPDAAPALGESALPRGRGARGSRPAEVDVAASGSRAGSDVVLRGRFAGATRELRGPGGRAPRGPSTRAPA